MHILDSSNREIAQTPYGQDLHGANPNHPFHEKMENRAHVCRAAKLPSPSGAPSPHPDGLSCPVPLAYLLITLRYL